MYWHLHQHLCWHLYQHLCWTCVSTCLGTCVSTYLGTCISTCVGTCVSTCLGICIRTCLGTCISTCVGTCVSTYLGICIRTCLGICISTCDLKNVITTSELKLHLIKTLSPGFYCSTLDVANLSQTSIFIPICHHISYISYLIFLNDFFYTGAIFWAVCLSLCQPYIGKVSSNFVECESRQMSCQLNGSEMKLAYCKIRHFSGFFLYNSGKISTSSLKVKVLVLHEQMQPGKVNLQRCRCTERCQMPTNVTKLSQLGTD